MFEKTPQKQEKEETREALDSRLEGTLKRIDFELLKTIFDEQRRRAGLETEINFITPEEIIYRESDNYSSETAVYNSGGNYIAIHSGNINKYAQWGKNNSFENVAFSALCHEETHAVSTRPHVQSYENGETGVIRP